MNPEEHILKNGWGTKAYRAGTIAAMAWLIWMQQTFIGRKEFDEYKSTHAHWGLEVVKHHDDKFNELRLRMQNIEAKLDRLIQSRAERP